MANTVTVTATTANTTKAVEYTLDTANRADAVYQKWTDCTFADMESHLLLVTNYLRNFASVWQGCTFVHGCHNPGTPNPANVLYGGRLSTFSDCQFYEAGFNQRAGTQQEAHGLWLTNDYNTVSACKIMENRGGYGIKITGSYNTINACTFSNNRDGDILVQGTGNVIIKGAGTTNILDQGSGTIIK